ncbi:MAG: hypothetical protein AB3N28_09860 [Kordiimonas sp.]
MVIAVSAVLISAASFVAAYVQSEAALRQVKAETWPFLQLDHGNTNETGQERGIYFRLVNAGVGPARVKKFQLFYDDKEVRDLQQIIYDCCVSEDVERAAFWQQLVNSGLNIVTDEVPPIVPDDSYVQLFTFPYNFAWTEETVWPDVWKKYDKIRSKITASVCYCSLLDECYQSNLKDDPIEVKACYPEGSREPS